MNQIERKDVLTPAQVGAILVATFFLYTLFLLVTHLLDTYLALLIGELLMVVPVLGFILLKKMPLLSTFRLRRISLRQVLMTLVLCLAVFVLTDELDRLIQLVFPMPQSWVDALADFVNVTTWFETIMFIGAGVVVAGFAEEMLFRGIIQRTLETYREPAIAIVLSAVFFALVHFNPWTTIQITILGIVLGYISWKSRSILPAVLFHGLNNLFSFVVMNNTERFAWYAGETHVHWMWIVASILLFYPAFKGFNQSCESRENT